MIHWCGMLLSHFPLAETDAERRGRLLGYFLGAVLITIIGLVLVIRNRKK